MAIQPIARMGADILKRRAAEVTDFTDPALPALVNDMIETMMSVRGIGLAAPQISAGLRVVIYFVPGERNGGVGVPLTVMVNPVLYPAAQVQEEGWEACLSVPGLTGRVPRFTSLRYSYQTLKGERVEGEAQGFHARVMQHECDHLDGVLYPQRITDMTSLAFTDVLTSEAAAAGKTLDLDPEG